MLLARWGNEEALKRAETRLLQNEDERGDKYHYTSRLQRGLYIRSLRVVYEISKELSDNNLSKLYPDGEKKALGGCFILEELKRKIKNDDFQKHFLEKHPKNDFYISTCTIEDLIFARKWFKSHQGKYQLYELQDEDLQYL